MLSVYQLYFHIPRLCAGGAPDPDIQRHVRTQRSYYQNVHKLQEKVRPLRACNFISPLDMLYPGTQLQIVQSHLSMMPLGLRSAAAAGMDDASSVGAPHCVFSEPRLEVGQTDMHAIQLQTLVILPRSSQRSQNRYTKVSSDRGGRWAQFLNKMQQWAFHTYCMITYCDRAKDGCASGFITKHQSEAFRFGATLQYHMMLSNDG